jgi:hypothetical protein
MSRRTGEREKQMEPNAQAFAEPSSNTQQGLPNRIQILLATLLSLAVLIAAYFSSHYNGLGWVVTGIGLALGILQWLLPPFVVKGKTRPGKLKGFLQSLKKRAFPIYITIVILLLLANVILYFVKLPGSSPSITITSPQKGSHVPIDVVVEGTASGIPQDKQIWLLVVPAGTAGYFPQNGPVVVSAEGNWTANADLGGKDSNDVGREFVLYTALVGQNDREAQDAFSNFFKHGKQTGSYLPIDPLPKGIQLVSHITVVRT